MLLNHDGVPARLMKEPETLSSGDLMLNLAANEARTYPSADEAWGSRHPMCIVLERGELGRAIPVALTAGMKRP